MKLFHPPVRWLLIGCLLVKCARGGEAAADDAGKLPKTGTSKSKITLFVRGAECPACAYSVMNSLREASGVKSVAEDAQTEVWMNVTYDADQIGLLHMARAVWKATPLHGYAYQAYLKLRIPDYGFKDNARRFKAVLKPWDKWLETVIADRDRGEILLRFKPFVSLRKLKTPIPKWSLEQLLESIRNEAGLKVLLMDGE